MEYVSCFGIIRVCEIKIKVPKDKDGKKKNRQLKVAEKTSVSRNNDDTVIKHCQLRRVSSLGRQNLTQSAVPARPPGGVLIGFPSRGLSGLYLYHFCIPPVVGNVSPCSISGVMRKHSRGSPQTKP